MHGSRSQKSNRTRRVTASKEWLDKPMSRYIRDALWCMIGLCVAIVGWVTALQFVPPMNVRIAQVYAVGQDGFYEPVFDNTLLGSPESIRRFVRIEVENYTKRTGQDAVGYVCLPRPIGSNGVFSANEDDAIGGNGFCSKI